MSDPLTEAVLQGYVRAQHRETKELALRLLVADQAAGPYKGQIDCGADAVRRAQAAYAAARVYLDAIEKLVSQEER